MHIFIDVKLTWADFCVFLILSLINKTIIELMIDIP